MVDPLYRESFSRNLGILTEAEQEQLARATVAIAGLGGIGGSTLITLTRMGVGGFRLADFDRFEYANINRQYGASTDTRGQLKCEILAEEVRRINPSLRLEIFTEGFTDSTADALLAGADAVIDAIDFYAIEDHLAFHRKAREHQRFVLMGSPVGFSACLQIFDPEGMSLEEYCAIRPEMLPIEKHLRYACGLVPSLAHIDYSDISAGGSRTDFLTRTGPSIASACQLAASLVAMEVVLLLLRRRPPRTIPRTVQFDPYTYRYENVCLPGGMRDYNPEAAIARIPDKSSLVAQALNLFYRKPKAPKCMVSGAELSYKAKGSGEELLLISPLGADSEFWARNAPVLSQKHRVITFDNRGSGQSRDSVDQFSTELMARDALALLDDLGIERAHVAGLALGGLVATQMARIRPDRIRSLILASSYIVADDHMRSVTAEWRNIAEFCGMEALFDQCIEWLFSESYASRRSDINQLRMFYRLTLQEIRAFVAQSLAGIAHDATGWIGNITTPALVLGGTADRLVLPQHSPLLGQSMQNARLVMLDNAPHFFHWECAGRFNREVFDFLSQQNSIRTIARAMQEVV